MVLDRFSQQKKIVIVVCCILIASACILFVIGFTTQAAMREHFIQLHLKNVASGIAGQVNGDGLSSLRPGDDGNPVYLAFARTLYDARKNDTFITNAYLMRVDNGTISYLVDDAYLIEGPGPGVAPTGELATEDRQTILNAMVHGPQYSAGIYTSKWGSFLSGYAPVRDSNGTVVAVLGVDEPADTVIQYEISSMFNLVEVG